MVQLLDTTLRDGSYVVDFQFAPGDTAALVAALDRCGVGLIEIGHGLGLGADKTVQPLSAGSDREHMEAAAGAARNSLWGVLVLPQVATLADVDAAIAMGAGFLRIGVDVDRVETAEPYLQRAAGRGARLFCNLLKTYQVDVEEAGRKARRAAEMGAEVVTIVDSAGGMLPDEVAAYVSEAVSCSGVSVGFHGHDNLGLAVANALSAVESGAEVVDATLRGIGRSAGNASSERLVAALHRKGVATGVDLVRLMDIAEELVAPILLGRRREVPLDLAAGYARLHSSFLTGLEELSVRYQVDLRELLLHSAEETAGNLSLDRIEAIARRMAGQTRRNSTGFASIMRHCSLHEAAKLGAEVALVASEAMSIGRKLASLPVFNLVQAFRPDASARVSPVIHTSPGFVLYSAEVCTAAEARELVEGVTGKAERLLLDCDIKSERSLELVAAAEAAASDLNVLRYSDLACWARSVAMRITEQAGFSGRSVRVVGAGELADRCFAELSLLCRDVSRGTGGGCDILVVCGTDAALDSRSLPTTMVIDAILGGMSEEYIIACRAQGVPVYRPDMRAAIQGELVARERSRELAVGRGSGVISGIPVAAGGIVARQGTVIVDSLTRPRQVFGVADGRGKLLPAAQLGSSEQAALSAIEEACCRWESV